MTREEIKRVFDFAQDSFDVIKTKVEKMICYTKYSYFEYFEIFPYSYQRRGFKQGKLLENLNRIKKTKDLYEYSFDKEDRIIMVKEGISIESHFYYQFLIYKEDCIVTYNFDNNKSLINVQNFIFDKKNNQVISMISKAKYGAKEELYTYEEGRLKEIKNFPYEARREIPKPYKEIFEYTEAGELKQITKSFENGYSEVIYEI